MSIVRIPISSHKYPDLFAMIDEEDAERVLAFKWRVLESDHATTLYAKTNTTLASGKRTGLQMHRLILDAPPTHHVDHINFDGLDNRRSNLRLCTVRESIWHRRKLASNTSGYIGVLPLGNRWLAQMYSRDGQKRRNIRIGTFDSPEEAARAYDAKAREIRGAFAVLNFASEDG
jgi:hypothetical protein